MWNDISEPPADLQSEVQRLRSAGTLAVGCADEARMLAQEIDRRRIIVLERDDDCVARHTADVWSSRAADISRTRLQRGVGFALWMVSVGLRETMQQLEVAAVGFEDDARSFQQRADQLEASITPP